MQNTEAEAIAKIRELGGQVLPLAQKDDRLDVSFYLQPDSVSDDSLRLLQDLNKIACLNLRGTPITDKGLEQLQGLQTLTRLHLEMTRITDTGLKHLKGLKNLTYLNLYGTRVSDKGLEHLKGLTQLRKLYLWQTDVTSAGSADLKRALPDLEIVQGWAVEKEEKDDQARESSSSLSSRP